MEEFLQNLKTLRHQMNDVEDQAAKISVEEQMQITTIQNLQKDLDSAKSETIRVKEDTDLMMKAKGQICSQILERQRKIATLESDSCTLSQTLELIQQEIVSLSAKFIEKRAYYNKVEIATNTELLEQQEWIKSNKLRSKLGQHCQVESEISEQTTVMEAARGNCNSGSHLNTDNMDESEKSLMESFDAAKTKFDAVAQMKFNLVSEIIKVRHSIELVMSKIADYKPELQEMDNKSLEEDIQALLSDKAAETEYMQSLQNQIEILKGISHVVKCNCGVEYKIDLVSAY